MNSQTWEALQSHGVAENTEIRLDFAYDAPDKNAAEQLAAFLHEETDYDVRSEGSAVTGFHAADDRQRVHPGRVGSVDGSRGLRERPLQVRRLGRCRPLGRKRNGPRPHPRG